MNKLIVISFGLSTLFYAACGNNNSAPAAAPTADTITKTQPLAENQLPDPAAFRDTVDGQPTALYILKSKEISIAITNYGARVVSLIVPDKNGKPTDVVLGYDSIGKYIHQPDTYFGAVVGRYGNRIAGAHFKLEGKDYMLAANNGPNSLHGGKKGFDAVVWTGKQLSDSMLMLTYLSKDGEEGYPGNLKVTVFYLLEGGRLTVNYKATTDQPTVLNLTNHSYFNLNGQGSGPIANHQLAINADHYTPVDSTLIPTGKIAGVAGTPFDFRKPTAIGARVGDTTNQQIRYGKGYDHNFVLNPGTRQGPAAIVQGDQSGIVLAVITDQPGIQFYGGNVMTGTNPLKAGKTDTYRSAFCLETQHFPDSPNEPSFPSTELKPGQKYNTETIFLFSAK